MKRIVRVCIFVGIFMALLGGCGEKPDAPVIRFSDAMIQSDTDTMKTCMTEEDDILGLFDTDDEFISMFGDYVKGEMLNTTYKIKSVEPEKDSCTVTVAYTVTDIKPIVRETYKEFLKRSMEDAIAGIYEEDDDYFNDTFLDAFYDSVESKHTRTTTIDVNFICKRQKGKWLIDGFENREDLANVLSCNLVAAIDSLNLDDGEETTSEVEPNQESDAEKIDSNGESSDEGIVYGRFYQDLGAEGYVEGEVGVSSGEGSNFIHLDCWGGGGHEIIAFDGTLIPQEDGSFYSHCEYYNADIYVTFYEDSEGYSMRVDVTSSDDDLMSSINGWYDCVEVTNFNEAG